LFEDQLMVIVMKGMFIQPDSFCSLHM